MQIQSKKIDLFFLSAIFIGGYASLALELIILRNLSTFVGNTSVTASVIISTVLLFMALGYYQGSTLSLKHKGIRQRVASDFLKTGVLSFFAATFLVNSFIFSFFYAFGISSNILQAFLFTFLMLSCPSYLFGKITALISRYFHRTKPYYTGRILATDTLGSVLGSLLTTLVLMPLIGVNHTVTILIFILFFFALLFQKKKRILTPLIILLLSLFYNGDSFLKSMFSIVKNNAISTIVTAPGDEGKSLILQINGSQSAKLSKDNALLFPYIQTIEENFIETMPKDTQKDVLILGAGGFVLGKSDTYHNYTYIDIEKSLLDIAESFFKEKLSANKKFIVQDANLFLKQTQQKYDLVVLDIYGSKGMVLMDFVTKEFFTTLKKTLKPNAVLVINIIQNPAKKDAFSQKIENTLSVVFQSNLTKIIPDKFNPWNNAYYNTLYTVINNPLNSDIYTDNKNDVILDTVR